jgi:hypothetical protein
MNPLRKVFRRVSPCPCGSGLIFCRCHGDKKKQALCVEAAQQAAKDKMAELIEIAKKRKRGKRGKRTDNE